LGRLTGRPVVANLLIKNPALASGPQLKDLTLPEDKRAALAGRFVIDPGALVGESRRDVLLLDDLYDSGATMQSACTALGGCQKISRILVATLTWK